MREKISSLPSVYGGKEIATQEIMRRILMDTEPGRGEYKEFRKLLRNGIGSRSQRQFAAETGISKEHINRMLNNKEIDRPTAGTLEKIAAAMDTVALDDLLIACGYKTYDIKNRAIKSTGKVKAALNAVLAEPFNNWKSIEDMIETVNILYVSNINGGFRVINTGTCEESKDHHWAETYAILEFVWREGDYSCKTWVILFFIETKSGRIIPADYAMDLESLIKYNAVTETMTDNKEHSVLGENGIYVYFRNIKKTTENEVKKTRLLSWLFSGEGRYITTVIGYGFYYPHTPNGFKQYLMTHAASFCTTKENRKLFEAAIKPGADPGAIFASYEGKNGFSSGTGAVVADILSMETGKEFLYMPKDEYIKDDGMGREHQDDSCIMVEEEFGMESRMPMDVLKVIYGAAKELGILAFGVCYHLESYNKTKMQWYKTDEFHLEYHR